VSDTVRPPDPRIASDPQITPDRRITSVRRIVGFLSAWLSSGHVRSWRPGTARAMTTPQRRHRNDAPSGGVRAVGGATVLVAWGTLPSVSTGWLEPGVSPGGTRWGGARAGDLSVATCSPRFPRRVVPVGRVRARQSERTAGGRSGGGVVCGCRRRAARAGPSATDGVTTPRIGPGSSQVGIDERPGRAPGRG